MKKILRMIEAFLIFIVPPALVYLKVLPKSAIMPLLWIITLYAYVIMRRARRFEPIFHFDKQEMIQILNRFFVLAPLMLFFVWLVFPNLLFSLVIKAPKIWLMVMVLYPLLSVVAQEILFRSFFVHRYYALINNEKLFIILNALIFAYIHSVFGNIIAIGLSFFGGILFMQTYLRSGSVLMSSIEHMLYGNLIFTLGIGNFFYHGA